MLFDIEIPVMMVAELIGTYTSYSTKGFSFPDDPTPVWGVSFQKDGPSPRVATARLSCTGASASSAVDMANHQVERALQLLSVASGTGFVSSKYDAKVTQLDEAQVVKTELETGEALLEVCDHIHVRESVTITVSHTRPWYNRLNEVTLPSNAMGRRAERALDFFHRGLVTTNPVPRLLSFYTALEVLVPPPEPGLNQDQIDSVIESAVHEVPEDVRQNLTRHLRNSLGHYAEVPKKQAWHRYLQQYWPELTYQQVAKLIDTRNGLVHGNPVEGDFAVVSDIARQLLGMTLKSQLGLERTDGV